MSSKGSFTEDMVPNMSPAQRILDYEGHEIHWDNPLSLTDNWEPLGAEGSRV